ncbi:helix-turn-helix domain-containing protein [Geodermatophilus sp. DSM 44513]|uniref:helix-turn-helix domain-containing protein n=1 Tax=Geodermatophilus sp. DSM 44513 TaxID=1528104 RepID=UPI00128A6B1D|nr:helix-turn-helix domain-containing protein [Geodermatophilus sp. DSM 44513]WNV74133.1 helix-turn-helix domain-containing protein [Geodermatophilus sp. DSM 44513]
MTLVAERWTPADLPRGERDDAFADAVGATHLPWSLRPGPAVPGPVELTRYRVGDLTLVDCRCGPCSGSRGRAQLAATDADLVGVLFVREGTEHIEVGDARVVVGPGAALLWRADQPVRFRVPGRLHKWTLLVPSSRLPATPTGLLDGPAAGLLAALVGTTIAGAGALDGRLGPPVADALVDLLAGVLSPVDDDPAWARVTAYVAGHLREPSLSPPSIAAGAYLSVRALYALCAARGTTPAGYVRRLRLEGARRELARRGTAVTVASVAHGWGFGDPATFGRGFRAAFGCAPDDVRRGTG